MPISDTIRRLLRYRMCLEKFKRFGWETTFSYTIAKESGLSSEQIRKDFSKFKISGHKKGGYNINEILDKINQIFEKHVTDYIIIIGSGNIGEALINYNGFEKVDTDFYLRLCDSKIKLKEERVSNVYHVYHPGTHMGGASRFNKRGRVETCRFV